jgi:hypothetical protein
MFGPGAYRPDPSEGITAIADLPQPEIVPYRRNDKRQPCPRCGHSAYRDKQFQRMLHDLGNLDLWCPSSRWTMQGWSLVLCRPATEPPETTPTVAGSDPA